MKIKLLKYINASIFIVLIGTIISCTGESKSEHSDEEVATESREEHSRDEGEDGEGEESGEEFSLDGTYDKVRNGARLVISFDTTSNSFTGTVENTTENVLSRVRVEVHLSNGMELGPTTPVDLEPGEIIDVRLTPDSTDFEKWTAHPEVGSGEGGEGEHGSEDEEHEGKDNEEEHGSDE